MKVLFDRRSSVPASYFHLFQYFNSIYCILIEKKIAMANVLI